MNIICFTFRSGAKNVIIFVVDGMGIATTVAARIYKVININQYFHVSSILSFLKNRAKKKGVSMEEKRLSFSGKLFPSQDFQR